jgi:hypothetical protein
VLSVIESSPPGGGSAARINDAPPAAELRGVIDNVGADRLYGWAWNLASPEERVAVELRLRGRTLLRTNADFARPDLPKAGIGDGAHAFEIRLEPEWIRDRSELSVVAIAADGTEKALPFRIHRTPEATAAVTQRTLEAMIARQRQVEEAVQALATRLPARAASDAAPRLEAAQARLDERLATLEVWLARMDERLAALPAAAAAPAGRRTDAWQLALLTTLGLSGLAALGAALVFLAA